MLFIVPYIPKWNPSTPYLQLKYLAFYQIITLNQQLNWDTSLANEGSRITKSYLYNTLSSVRFLSMRCSLIFVNFFNIFPLSKYGFVIVGIRYYYILLLLIKRIRNNYLIFKV